MCVAGRDLLACAMKEIKMKKTTTLVYFPEETAAALMIAPV